MLKTIQFDWSLERRTEAHDGVDVLMVSILAALDGTSRAGSWFYATVDGGRRWRKRQGNEMNDRQRVIAYYRVSTQRQGRSGLGLDGQEDAVKTYAAKHGCRVAATYIEIESGRRNDRPELAKALAHAKLARSTIVVAKLDRLARNVAFLSALMESGVEFRACDNEHANRLTIHVLAAVAEDEARRISERTAVALQAAKRRGVLLGSLRPGHWVGREDRRAAGRRKAVTAASRSRSQAALDVYAFLMPSIREWRSAGETLDTIATRLNETGHATRAGLPFTPTAVHRLLLRAAKRPQ